jgi:hypothetical protein
MGLDVFLGGGCRAWSKAPDLRSGDAGLRGFESLPPHFLLKLMRYCFSPNFNILNLESLKLKIINYVNDNVKLVNRC